MSLPEKILTEFNTVGKFLYVKPIGNGHINSTYVAAFDNCGKTVKYLLQKINTEVFPNVDKLMQNIVGVTEYLCGIIKERGGDTERECLNVILAKDGKPYFCDEIGEYYRLYNFIDDAVSYEHVENPEQFYELGIAFGNFANVLNNYNASTLYEVIPDFHNTQKRYEAFISAENKNLAGRKNISESECKFAHSRMEYADKIVKLIAEGKIPVRVTHNDTKLNNVLFDNSTKKPLAILDLDTIMPGSILYDFGDAIRFGCSTAPENEKDLSKVNFDFELFKLFAKGYLEALGDIVTACEKENLAFSAILITYELGLRFLTDYLNGDKYFTVHYDSENLDRTRTQFKLVTEMEKMLPEMKKFILSIN